MQMMDGHPPPRVGVHRLYAILAIEPRKHDLADIRARLHQRSPQHRIGQVLPKTMHDPKDCFGGLLAVRHLHRQCPRPRDQLVPYRLLSHLLIEERPELLQQVQVLVHVGLPGAPCPL